jgi:hypothetical protein
MRHGKKQNEITHVQEFEKETFHWFVFILLNVKFVRSFLQ